MTKVIQMVAGTGLSPEVPCDRPDHLQLPDVGEARRGVSGRSLLVVEVSTRVSKMKL